MKPEMVLRAYEQLSAAPRSPMLEPMNQFIVVCDDDGLRLILTRIDERVQLDVEVSIPNLKTTRNDDNDAMTRICREAAIKSIRRLEFLVILADYGFALAMEKPEFLWIASTILTDPPSDSLLTLLQKPY